MSQWHTGAVKLSERIKSTFYTHAIINLQYNHPVLRHDLLIAPCSKLHLAYDSDKACMWYPCRVKASPCRVIINTMYTLNACVHLGTCMPGSGSVYHCLDPVNLLLAAIHW